MSSPITVFLRGSDGKEFVEKLLDSVDLTDRKFVDINSKLPERVKYGISFGKICGRLVTDMVDNLLILPTIQQLQPNESNRAFRRQGWEDLQSFKTKLSTIGSTDSQPSKSWKYATIFLGDKKMCIYEDELPPNIEADVFISRADSDLLVRIKEAFRAEAVLIGEEHT